MPYPSVRYIGSRELHRDLPKVLESLEDPSARFVLTIHSKPKAVLIGAEAFLALLKGHTPQDRILALQLGALVRGLEASADSDSEVEADPDDLPEAEAEDELRQGLVVAAV
jgi:PHD/YefM family antitoxin component YafN of YafNO toxin-antitoxin module